MKRLCAVLSVFITLASAAVVGAQAQAVDLPTPEMKRISFMVGNFRGTTKIFGRDGATTELQVVHRSDWTAEGQFILIQGKRGNDKTGVAVLWGYDPQEKVYRSWQFLSAPFSVGKPVELTGKFEGERLVMEGKLGDALVRSTVQRKEGGGWKVLSERKRESEWVRISTQDIVPAK